MLTKWFMRFYIIEENRRYNEQECSLFKVWKKLNFLWKLYFWPWKIDSWIFLYFLSLLLICQVYYTQTYLSFVLNIRPHGFYPFFRFNDIFCRWLLSIREAFSPRIPHGFSFGLGSGLNADHGSGFIPKSWNHIFIVAARRIGALSRWKIVFLIPSSDMKGNNSPCNISLTTTADMLKVSCQLKRYYYIIL